MGGKHGRVSAADVYKSVRQALAPFLKASAFAKASGAELAWQRPIAARLFLVLWAQVSRDGWDDFAGSRFTMQFERSKKPGVAHGQDYRRLAFFLNAEQLETLTAIQNSVIRKLEKPRPGQHVVFELGAELVKTYEAKFEPVKKRYNRTDDVWLRYHDLDDVQRWADFILGVLPNVLGPFQDSADPPIWRKGGAS